MKRVIVLLALCTGITHADPRPTIKPPAGWRLDVKQSEALGTKLKSVSHFGLAPGAGETVIANADVYVAPKPGVVLSVILVGTTAKAEREAAARAAVDELHAASQRAALSGSGIVEEGWQEKVDPAAKQIEATLAWRDTNAKTSSTARLLIVADDAHMTSLTGECFAADDADAAEVAACKQALATLDPGIETAKRVALALAPTGTRPTTPASEPSGREPARMSDGSRAPMPPMTIPQEPRTADRRPVYVGLGLVVMAAAFWWNRRRRARREEQSDER
jgi:hypothetical protein